MTIIAALVFIQANLCYTNNDLHIVTTTTYSSPYFLLLYASKKHTYVKVNLLQNNITAPKHAQSHNPQYLNSQHITALKLLAWHYLLCTNVFRLNTFIEAICIVKRTYDVQLVSENNSRGLLDKRNEAMKDKKYHRKGHPKYVSGDNRRKQRKNNLFCYP